MSIYVQIASFVRAFGKQFQKRFLVQSDEKFKKLHYRSKKLVKLSIESIVRMFLTSNINNFPTGEFLCLQKCNGVASLWLSGRPLTHSPLIRPHFTVEASNKVLKTVDI